MKILSLLLFFTFTLSTSYGQNKQNYYAKERNQLSFGYGLNPLGVSANLMYGFRYSKSTIYGGVRFHENSPYNFSDPENSEVFRHDDGGLFAGVITGYQRNFELIHSAITPFAGIELEYAYLSSRMEGVEWNTQTSQFDPTIWKIPARSLLIPSLNIGFEAQLHKNFYLRQSLGGASLLDYGQGAKLDWFTLPQVNGLGINAKLSVLFRF